MVIPTIFYVSHCAHCSSSVVNWYRGIFFWSSVKCRFFMNKPLGLVHKWSNTTANTVSSPAVMELVMPFLAKDTTSCPCTWHQRTRRLCKLCKLVLRLGMCVMLMLEFTTLQTVIDSQSNNCSRFNFTNLLHVLKLFAFYLSSFLGLLSELLLLCCLLPSPASPGLNIIARKGSGESCSPRKGSIKDRLEWPRYKPLCYRHCNLPSWLILVFNYSFPQRRNLFAFQYPDISFPTCNLSLLTFVLLCPSQYPFP